MCIGIPYTHTLLPIRNANYTKMLSNNTNQNHTILLEPSDSLYIHPHSDPNVHANIPQHALIICNKHADIILELAPEVNENFCSTTVIHLVARRTPTQLARVLSLPYWLSCSSNVIELPERRHASCAFRLTDSFQNRSCCPRATTMGPRVFQSAPA